MKRLSVALAAGALAVCGPALVRADEPAPPARCAIHSILATAGAGGVDPQLTRLRPYLERPPFSSWKSFKLLSQQEQTIAPGATAQYALPTGNDAVVTYARHELDPAG